MNDPESLAEIRDLIEDWASAERAKCLPLTVGRWQIAPHHHSFHLESMG